MTKPDVLLVAAKSFDWPAIREYVTSLERTGFEGKKVAFVDHVTDYSRRKLELYGFELIDFEANEPPKVENRMPGWLFSIARWTPVVEYLRTHKDEFRYVIWTDIGDVIFQTNPSEWLEENLGTFEIVGATEGTLTKDSPMNAEWVKDTIPNAYDALASLQTCCAGTLAGTAERFLAVAEIVKEVMAAAGSRAVDQAALNYALYMQPRGVVMVPALDAGWTCTCSWVIGLQERYGQPGLPVVEGTVFPVVDRTNGKIYTGDRSPRLFSIVHQYNRDHVLLAAINKQYQEAPPKVLIAVKSCKKYQIDGVNDVVRNSWLRDIKQFPNATYKFFIIDGEATQLDEAVCMERHGELRWSVQHNYDYTFVVWPDTIVDLERLLKSDFERFEFSGRADLPVYGPCCWVSKKAAKAALKELGKSLNQIMPMAVNSNHAIRQVPRRTNDIISTFVFESETLGGQAWSKECIKEAWRISRAAMRPPVAPSSFRPTRLVTVAKPKALIAISTCQLFQNNGNNDAVRETWAKDVAAVEGLDYKFFTGGPAYLEDEVHLDVLDDYQHVTYKTVGSRRWALEHGYDFIFQTFPDVYIRPERLMAALDTTKDYVGYPLVDGHPYASGGAGYWQSKQAAEYLLLEGDPWDWAEDRWVGEIMLKRGFTLWSDKRYSPIAQPVLKRNTGITSHLSRSLAAGQAGIYKKIWMYNVHRFWTLSQKVTP